MVNLKETKPCPKCGKEMGISLVQMADAKEPKKRWCEAKFRCEDCKKFFKLEELT